MALVSIKTPAGRTILPATETRPERVLVELSQVQLIALMEALTNGPELSVSYMEAEVGTSLDELVAAYEDLIGEEY